MPRGMGIIGALIRSTGRELVSSSCAHRGSDRRCLKGHARKPSRSPRGFATQAVGRQTLAMIGAEKEVASKTLKGAVWLVLGLAGMFSTGDAIADTVTPIEVTMLGPSAVRVRVASGFTMPCDSGDNRMLLQGKFEPGEVLHTSTAERCVCVQQTYAPFADVDWAAGTMACSPLICTWAGRSKKCVPALDPTIRISIRATR